MGLRIKMERLKDAFTIVEAQVVNVDDTLNLVRAKTPCLENKSSFSWLACLFAMEILQLPSKSSKASKSYHDAQQWVLIEVVGTWCQPNHDSHEGWTVWKSRMGLRIKMERLKDAFTIVEAQVVNVDDTLNLVRAKTPCLENESLFSWLACFLPWKSCNCLLNHQKPPSLTMMLNNGFWSKSSEPDVSQITIATKDEPFENREWV